MHMKKEPEWFTSPKQLKDWIDNNDLLLTLDDNEVLLLMNYLEGHDYAIGIIDEKLVRIDISDSEEVYEEYTIDEFIDTVCEWNYDLIVNTKFNMENAPNHQSFCQERDYYEKLKRDKKILDGMYDKTCYGKQLHDVCAKLTEEMIDKMKKAEIKSQSLDFDKEVAR